MTTAKEIQARLELPFPPSINRQHSTVNDRRVLSTVSRKRKGAAEKAIRPLRVQDAVSGALVIGLRHGVAGLFIAYYETSRRRDRDGGPRITQDAICGRLGVSDNSAVDVHLDKRIGPLRPRSEVELEAILDWEFGTRNTYSGADSGPTQ